jgi:hypothetical protein
MTSIVALTRVQQPSEPLPGQDYECAYRSDSVEIVVSYSSSNAPPEDSEYLCHVLSPINRGSAGVLSPWTLVYRSGATTFCRLPNCSSGPPPETTQALHLQIRKPLTLTTPDLVTTAGPLLTIPADASPDDAPAAITAWIALQPNLFAGSGAPLPNAHPTDKDPWPEPPPPFPDPLFHMYRVANTLYESAMLPVGTYVVIPIL